MILGHYSTKIGLWRKNKITGYWNLERNCEEATAKDWLKLFQKDSPTEVYKLAKRRPKD